MSLDGKAITGVYWIFISTPNIYFEILFPLSVDGNTFDIRYYAIVVSASDIYAEYWNNQTMFTSGTIKKLVFFRRLLLFEKLSHEANSAQI